MRVSEQTRDQIMAVLQRLVEAAGRKDVGSIMALTDPDFRGFGSGIDEKVIGREASRRHIERDFSQVETFALSLSDVQISAEGTVAWVMADLTCHIIADGVPQDLDGRMTMVLRGTGHAWIIAQVHYSLPAEERSYPEA